MEITFSPCNEAFIWFYNEISQLEYISVFSKTTKEKIGKIKLSTIHDDIFIPKKDFPFTPRYAELEFNNSEMELFYLNRKNVVHYKTISTFNDNGVETRHFLEFDDFDF